MSATIVWFQLDLRLDDQPALGFAVAAGDAVIPVYCLDLERQGKWAPTGASNWWLHESLKSLDESLRAKGSRLILRGGDAVKELMTLAKESGASAIAYNRRYEPWVHDQEEALHTAAQSRGISLHRFQSSLLFNPQSFQQLSVRSMDSSLLSGASVDQHLSSQHSSLECLSLTKRS